MTGQKKIDALIEEAMSQVQVFASAWSMVGGPFDDGDCLETAEVEKHATRALFRDLINAAIDLAAPTQGADARPVAIYQVRARGDDKWSDVLEGVYDSCHRLHSHKFETRIVHESLPPDCEPVGEIVTFGKDPEVKEASWAKGKMPSVGTKLYATRDAAPSDQVPFGYVHVIASIARPHDPVYRFSKKSAIELNPEYCSLVETVPVFRAEPREKTS